MIARVPVRTPGRDSACEIVAGRAALEELSAFLTEHYPGYRAVAIGDEEALRHHQPRLAASLPKGTPILAVPPGEDSKSRSEKARLEDELLRRRLGRDTVVLGFGGGVVTDLAGFVAATYLRGVPFVPLPTTLLAAVDASVGGKTGINTAYGKNLIGAIRQPAAVFADTALLATLPAAEVRNGLAEAFKMAATSDAALFAACERDLAALVGRDDGALTRLIAAAVRIKAAVVAADEQEAGMRQILNFGHTVAHGLERATGYRLAHGAAVAIGMIAECRMAALAGPLEAEAEARLRALIAGAGLPVRAPRELERAAVTAAFGSDKKARGGEPRFVLLEDIGRVRDRDNEGATAYSFPVPPDVRDAGLRAIGL